MRERVGVDAAPVQYGTNVVGRHGFWASAPACGLREHLGGGADATSDAEERFGAVRLGLRQLGQTPEQFGCDGVHLGPGGQDGPHVRGERRERPLADARVVEVAPVLDARELGGPAADVHERAALHRAVARGADEAEVRLVTG